MSKAAFEIAYKSTNNILKQYYDISQKFTFL